MSRRLIETLRRVGRSLAPGFRPLRVAPIERALLWYVDRCRPEVLETRHGFELHLPRGHRSPLVLALYLYGEYEPEETRLLLERLAGARLVFDVGANVGYMTCLMARALAGVEDAEVHAFEPEPANFAILRDNVARNHLRGVVLRQLALARHGGEEVLHLAADNLGDHTLVALPGRRRVTIGTSTFDDYWAAHCGGRQVDLVKIDVQGYEFEVLSGMRECLRGGRVDHVLCEVWPARIRANGTPSAELTSFLLDLPYDGLVVSDTGAGNYRTLAELAAATEGLEREPHRFFNVLLSRRCSAPRPEPRRREDG